MKTGIELITIERQEQIEKHDRSIQQDANDNDLCQLATAASKLAQEEMDDVDINPPPGWDDPNIWGRMIKKPYKDRLIIAGALIAAEIDRLQY